MFKRISPNILKPQVSTKAVVTHDVERNLTADRVREAEMTKFGLEGLNKLCADAVDFIEGLKLKALSN